MLKATLEGKCLGFLSFALQQNCVPIIRSLKVTNTGDEQLVDAIVRISFEPDIAEVFEKKLSIVKPGEIVEISPVNIHIRSEYLFSLTEKLRGTMSLRLLCGNDLLDSYDNGIDLLAYDQWTGISVMPELLTAFITPNHPAVTGIISRAGKLMQEWTGSPSFYGYLTGDPNNVLKQMAALYGAIQDMNIAYALPPASFEERGQRVRMPSAVAEQKMGTCIDLSLMYASCLEAVGLHPLIILKTGHAFCGCWLVEESFSECVEDDISAVTKRMADGIAEIATVECTAMTAGSRSLSFDKAVELTKEHFEDPSAYEFAIDVRRSRGSGIRPIPARVAAAGGFEAVDSGARATVTSAPERTLVAQINTEAAPERELTKQQIWERKLLDLSLKNTLLSFRATQNCVQLMAGDLPVLEDALADGASFRILPKPADWENTLRDSKIYEIENARDAIDKLMEVEFKSKRLRTFLDEAELARRVKELHRRARTSLEENGSNVLYLALGFLRWFDSDVSEKERFAPLVLIPIEIIEKVQAREYQIRLRDEEPQMNITLLEMLRQDFGIDIGGLDPLPADESGIDLPLVFATVRRAVMEKKRWDVEELAFIGLFSFSQFIMWNDIHSRSDRLAENKIVKSLMSGKLEWIPEAELTDPATLDGKLVPSQMVIPTGADSSQLAAVCDAAAGQSFVLHGPPGTGKSQTITNIISNALFAGKSVLFVAAKAAALNVVNTRLEAIGLDPFCLKLHSNKARKRDVLDQLETALHFGRIVPPKDFVQRGKELYEMRAQLNEVVDSIHKERSYGMTLYEAMSLAENYSGSSGRLRFSTEDTKKLGPADIEKRRTVIDKLRTAALSGVVDSPLMCVKTPDYTASLRETAEELIPRYVECAEALTLSEIAAAAHCGDDKGSARKLFELACAACESDGALARLEGQEDLTDEVCALIEATALLRTELGGVFTADIFDMDVKELYLGWRRAGQSWALKKGIEQGKIVKELRLAAISPDSITKDNAEKYLTKLRELADKRAQIESFDKRYTACVAGVWKDENTDAEKLRALSRSAARLAAAAKSVGENAELTNIDRGVAARFKASAAPLFETEDKLAAAGIVFDDDTYAVSRKKAEMATAALSGLRQWCSFVRCCREAEECGVGNAADALINGSISPDELPDAFECAEAEACARYTIESEPCLSGFQGEQFELVIERYKKALDEFEELSIYELVSALSEKIPSTSAEMAATSETGILERAIRSGGRMMSIRKLFNTIPSLIRRLCPCMLMSPISVAQYIDPSFPRFDIVVFDEASQLPTCEAVGALARGDNAVIVGDPKQMPPTSFFSTNRIDDDNCEKEDLESLLDDCLAIGMPQKHLLWHYRSRHESLIAFSNREYYKNSLYTFPSPNDRISKVSLVNVDGFYDRGGTKQNAAEAKAVVEEICRRLLDSELCRDSLGVVTFSAVQQNLIEDLILDEFRRDPALEEANDRCHEQLFVKNLENVQGDERDVILFSIGYGPDQSGRLSMNFGPLNKEGGWRRLNVAISRARKEMKIFSALRPEQIDMSRTRSDGVAGLKGFLEFAEKGKLSLPVNSDQVQKAVCSAIEDDVADAVRSMGYTAESGVGCSRFKIDIGVASPDDPDTYILGIMLDGRGYKSACTARDRNIVQPRVLSSLGWRLYRIWSLDWVEDRARETEKLRAAIENAKRGAEEPHEDNVKKELCFEKAETVNSTDSCPYTPLIIKRAADPETFYMPSTLDNIGIVIDAIMKKEAPISRKLLMRRVASAWGITRVGPRVEAVVDSVMKGRNFDVKQYGDSLFYDVPDRGDIGVYRTPTDELSKRAMDDISPAEIANAVRSVVNAQFSLSRADLVRETAKLFGFTRTGGIIETAAGLGIEEAEKLGYITVSGDRISAV